MNKLFIIGLPRTGTTSISVALLEYFKVAHTGYTKRTFELADVISDCPCFCDYQLLDRVFPNSKFVYLDRDLDKWLPSIQMLLKKMQPSFHNQTYVSPILKRCFENAFKLQTVAEPLDKYHLECCYLAHKEAVLSYFHGNNNFLEINIAHQNSLLLLLTFLGVPHNFCAGFPHLNIGKRVDHWKEIKHINKVHSNLSGSQGRKYFSL